MKNKMIKLLAVLVFAVLCFASCAPKEPNAYDETPTPTIAENITPSHAETPMDTPTTTQTPTPVPEYENSSLDKDLVYEDEHTKVELSATTDNTGYMTFMIYVNGAPIREFENRYTESNHTVYTVSDGYIWFGNLAPSVVYDIENGTAVSFNEFVGEAENNRISEFAVKNGKVVYAVHTEQYAYHVKAYDISAKISHELETVSIVAELAELYQFGIYAADDCIFYNAVIDGKYGRIMKYNTSDDAVSQFLDKAWVLAADELTGSIVYRDLIDFFRTDVIEHTWLADAADGTKRRQLDDEFAADFYNVFFSNGYVILTEDGSDGKHTYALDAYTGEKRAQFVYGTDFLPEVQKIIVQSEKILLMHKYYSYNVNDIRETLPIKIITEYIEG